MIRYGLKKQISTNLLIALSKNSSGREWFTVGSSHFLLMETLLLLKIVIAEVVCASVKWETAVVVWSMLLVPIGQILWNQTLKIICFTYLIFPDPKKL